jgi:hypothetical protein
LTIKQNEKEKEILKVMFGHSSIGLIRWLSPATIGPVKIGSNHGGFAFMF